MPAPASPDRPGSIDDTVADPVDDLITSDADEVGRTAFVPSDNTTLTSVLDGLVANGFDGHFTPLPGGALACGRCGETSPAADFTVDTIRRLEGASDPDEMLAVAALTCPRCGSAGVAVLGYGPIASEADADVIVQLDAPATVTSTTADE